MPLIKYKKSLSFGLLVLVVLLINLGLKQEYKIETDFNTSEERVGKLAINLADKVEVFVDVANTDGDRQRGLSGREFLSPDEGMLFTFSQAGYYGFWMPNMNFPLDILWLKDNIIVDITENVSNEFDPKNPKIYYPQLDINQVIEVNAGFVAKHNLKVGDDIEI